jgi:hypothetical protein
MVEPDWDTLAVTGEDVDTSRRFARFLASRVRNATIGRDLGNRSVDIHARVQSTRAKDYVAEFNAALALAARAGRP